MFCHTWCIQPVGGAAGTNGRTLCPSSLHFLGPSTADAPGRWCLLCATANFSGVPQDLFWTLQPDKQTQRDTGKWGGESDRQEKDRNEENMSVVKNRWVWICCWGFVTWVHLKLDAGFSHSSEGCRLPVGLFSLFPHHDVEGRWVLVAKDEAGIVIIGYCIHVKRPLEVHSTESSITWPQKV